MKRIHLPIRLLTLLLAATTVFSLSACKNDSAASASETTTTVTEVKVPLFVNPLNDIILSVTAEPAKPSEDTLQKITKAHNQNSDVVGWLSVPNTTIDNEVMFYPDDKLNPGAQYYERRDITKAYNWYGCYWADYECTFGDRNNTSQNLVIYGHSMDDDINGLKFSQLKKYTDPEFAKKNPYIYFATPEDNMQFKVFSVMYTEKSLAYNHPNLRSAEFTALVKELKNRSVLNFDVDVRSTDKLITLSTCTYPTQQKNKKLDDDARFVVVGRLVRPGEETPDIATVEVNPTVRKPQYSEQ